MPGARCARSLVCKIKQAYEHSHHGHTGTTRHSPRNGFTAYFALSSVTTLFDTVACASYRRLDANDWGVRTTRLRRPRQHDSSSAPTASTASRPAFVTIAIRPSCRNETVRISELIWVGRKQKYFCKTGLTQLRKIRSDLPAGQNQSVEFVIARSDSDEANPHLSCREMDCFAALAMTGKNISVRHSGRVRRTRTQPGSCRMGRARRENHHRRFRTILVCQHGWQKGTAPVRGTEAGGAALVYRW